MSLKYGPQYRVFPDEQQREALSWTVNLVRQLYNDRLKRFTEIPESEGTVRQRVVRARDELPSMKDWWDDLTNVYSTVLQNAVMRIHQNIKGLSALKNKGFDVGELRWKAPRDYRSITYNKKGFELDKKSGPSNRAMLTLKKIRGDNIDVPIRLHRDLPDHETIQQLTVKQEPTGAWYVSFVIKTDEPDKPTPSEIDTEDCVGIDLGINTFIHDSDGREIQRLDLEDDRDRLESEQRSLSRKEYESNNWETQRKRVAEVHASMTNKKKDFKHKLAHFYTTQYDAVFLEDLNVKGMLESEDNARNKAEVGWRRVVHEADSFVGFFT